MCGDECCSHLQKRDVRATSVFPPDSDQIGCASCGLASHARSSGRTQVRRSLSEAKAKTDWKPNPSRRDRLLGPRATARQAILRSSSGKTAARPTRCTLPTKISKTTPCKVAWWSRPGCFGRSPRKHFDTSGKSVALFHHRAVCKTPRLSSWRPGIFDLNSTSRGPIEVVSEMHAEFPHVVLGAMYEARLPATEIWQPQHIQSEPR